MKRWWRDWAKIDLLGLGLGLGLCVAYYLRETADGGWGDPMADLWPNIATEILGVWLSVRIIGTIIDLRQRRSNMRNTLAGNMNHLMGICSRLSPHFDSFAIVDLRNELLWFGERRRLNAKLLKRVFSRDELALLERIADCAEQACEKADEARKARERDDESCEFTELKASTEGLVTNLIEQIGDFRRRIWSEE